jgi:formylglycine-generating enzyme
VDACRDDPTRGARGIDGNKVTLDRNTALLLSCGSGMQAYESKKKGHGAFFYFVLEALRGNNPKALNDNGDITWGRLRVAVEETFPTQFQIVMDDTSLKQEPQITDGMNGTTVLIPRRVLAAKLPKPGEEREYEIAPGTKMVFCWIPPGKATLGAPKNEVGRDSDDLDEREYTSKGFWLGKYEVTQGEWTALGVARKAENSFSAKGDFAETVKGMNTSRFPTENVSWNECQEFVKALNERSGVSRVFGKSGTFCLPHEDEWEYAVRGGKGNQQAYYWGTAWDDTKANGGYSLNRTTPVGSYASAAPHPWGLCDMLGNVWEWCENKYSNDSQSRVLRGGSWRSSPGSCRVAFRGRGSPVYRYYSYGFRVCLRLDE